MMGQLLSVWVSAVMLLSFMAALRTWPKRRVPGGLWFILTTFSAGVTFALELLHQSLSTPPFNYLLYEWLIVSLTGTVYSLFIFLAHYLGYTRILSGKARGLILLTYLLTVVGCLTNEWHGVMYITTGNCQRFYHELCFLMDAPTGIISHNIGHQLSSLLGFLGHFWSIGAISSIAFTVSAPNRQRLLLLGVAYCLPIIPLLRGSEALLGSMNGLNLDLLSYVASFSLILLLFYRFDLLDYPLAAWNRRNVEASSPVLAVTPDGHLIEFNQAARTLFGLENVNQPLSQFSPPLAAHPAEIELKGRTYGVEYDPSAQANAGTVITLTDLTERTQQAQALLASHQALALSQSALHHQAHHDALTGLFNRRHMDEILHQCQEEKVPVCAILADVDDFRTVNGRYGLAGGDEALRQIALRIQQECPPPAVPCRYGGEEFCILLPSTAPEQALARAEQLRTRIHTEPYLIGQQAVTLSVSIGTSDSHTSGYPQLLMAADHNLRSAKDSGKNRVVGGDPRPIWRRGWFA